jgi:chemotaxis-related protein WspB
MLYLLFQVGSHRYALHTADIVEVLPLMVIQPFPQAPPGVVGLIEYRGVPVSVVDLTRTILGQVAPHRLSTRLIIVRADAAGHKPQLLALIAERATDIFRRDQATGFGASGGSKSEFMFNADDGGGMVRRFDLQRLICPPLGQPALTLHGD